MHTARQSSGGKHISKGLEEILHVLQILPEDAQSAVLRLVRELAVAFWIPRVPATGLDSDREAALAEELAELRWTQSTGDRPCIGCSACGRCTLYRVVEDLPPRPLVLWCPACFKLEAVALNDVSVTGLEEARDA